MATMFILFGCFVWPLRFLPRVLNMSLPLSTPLKVTMGAPHKNSMENNYQCLLFSACCTASPEWTASFSMLLIFAELDARQHVVQCESPI